MATASASMKKGNAGDKDSVPVTGSVDFRNSVAGTCATFG
jgi:hypothetical protein